ncbi:hypothetical protein AB0N09_05270 [Streptomyces erythrochromogenes]|uniref:hypothetical protein n=1 Tax=Streptomyces erythrochromogenes TaxID=285574 RepID=UPI003427EEC2
MNAAATDALAIFLQAVTPAPAGETSLPVGTSHEALSAALTRRGVVHQTSGDSACEYAHIVLPGGYLISLHNPLGDDYGYDWQITDRDVLPVIAGTLRMGADMVAQRLARLPALTP